jgi:hypothetical protein
MLDYDPKPADRHRSGRGAQGGSQPGQDRRVLRPVPSRWSRQAIYVGLHIGRTPGSQSLRSNEKP